MITFVKYKTEKKDMYYEELCCDYAVPPDLDKMYRFKDEIKRGDVFPRIEVIKWKKHYEIEDGVHRASAYRLLKRKIPCIIYSQD